MEPTIRIILLLLAAVSAVAQPSAAALSLEEAVGIALEKNPSVAAEQAGIEAAEARVQQARAGFYPHLRFSESYTRSNNPVFAFSTLLLQRRFTMDDFAINRLNSPGSLQNFQSQLSAEQLVYDFGSRGHQVRAAQAGRSIAETGADANRLRVMDSVLRSYLAALLAEQAVETARQAEKSAGVSRDRAVAMREAGLATDADVLSIEVHLAEVREQVVRGEANLQVAHASLNEALGLPLDTVHQLRTRLLPLEATREPVADLEQSALRARPETRQIALAEEAAQAQARAARASLLPKVYLRGALEANRGTYVTNAGGNWTVAGALEWNFSTGRRDLWQARESEAIGRRTAADSQSLAARVKVEVRRAWHESNAARERIQVAEAAIAQAEESLRITRNRYENGLATVTDLLRTETALMETKLRYEQAVHDQRLAAAALEMAVGRLNPDSTVLR